MRAPPNDRARPNCSRHAASPTRSTDGSMPWLSSALVIDRLRQEPDGDALAQAFFDAMFRHLDLTLREIGVQDLGVGRRIKIMAEGLHGRALAYRDALSGGPTPLGEVLRRNAYGGRPPSDGQALDHLEAYVRKHAKDLSVMVRSDLTK